MNGKETTDKPKIASYKTFKLEMHWFFKPTNP
jgi:hypothetical protein